MKPAGRTGEVLSGATELQAIDTRMRVTPSVRMSASVPAGSECRWSSSSKIDPGLP